MKLLIYFRPAIMVSLLAIAAAAFWFIFAALHPGLASTIALALALFYTALFALAAFALVRLTKLELWRTWDAPGRLLILAPHEDDCVISAGGDHAIIFVR